MHDMCCLSKRQLIVNRKVLLSLLDIMIIILLLTNAL